MEVIYNSSSNDYEAFIAHDGGISNCADIENAVGTMIGLISMAMDCILLNLGDLGYLSLKMEESLQLRSMEMDFYLNAH